MQRGIFEPSPYELLRLTQTLQAAPPANQNEFPTITADTKETKCPEDKGEVDKDCSAEV